MKVGRRTTPVALKDSVTDKTTPDGQTYISWIWSNRAGGRLNKKDGLTRYGDSHVKDKTS